MTRWGFQVVPHILDKKLGAYRIKPGVWCNSTLCNCHSLRVVNHVMPITYVLLSVEHDEDVNPSNLSEVKDYRVIEYEPMKLNIGKDINDPYIAF